MKTAIVTGASGTIGGAITARLVNDGFFVFAQYNDNLKGIENLIEKLSDKKDCVYPIKFDLKKGQEIKSAVEKIKSVKQNVDVLVNCAGVGLYKLATETTEKEWNDLFSINVTGMQTLTSLVLDGMISQKKGKIVNVSSIWGVVGASMEVAYSASKSAIIGYTKALAKEVGYSGINVNCVCPGVIDTKMNARFSESEMAELIDSTPLGRIGKGEDVAELVGFLSSEKSDFITGQVITIDGGFTL